MSNRLETMSFKTAFGALQEGVRPSDTTLAKAIDDLREDCYTLPEAVVSRRGTDLVDAAAALGNREGFADSTTWEYIEDLRNKLSVLA